MATHISKDHPFTPLQMIFMSYPVLSRMGYGCSIKDAIFMSYGGLRGAVGLALAMTFMLESRNEYVIACSSPHITYHKSHIARHTSHINHLRYLEDPSEESHLNFRESVRVVFHVGGGAFLTMLVLSPTSGALLAKLGLTAAPASKEALLEGVDKRANQRVRDDYAELKKHGHAFDDLNHEMLSDLLPALQAEAGGKREK